MKRWLLAFIAVVFFQTVFGQSGPGFTLAAAGKSMLVKLSEDFDNYNVPTFTIPSSGNYNFTISVKNESKREWIRSFFITDADNNEVTEVPAMKNKNAFCIHGAELQKAINKETIYNLYTVAIPADKEKAMLVKVARRLAAKLRLD